MGLEDLLGKAAGIAKGAADSGAKAVGKRAEELRHNSKLMDYKRQILNSLSTGQLKGLAGYYAIEPSEPLRM